MGEQKRRETSPTTIHPKADWDAYRAQVVPMVADPQLLLWLEMAFLSGYGKAGEAIQNHALIRRVPSMVLSETRLRFSEYQDDLGQRIASMNAAMHEQAKEVQ